MYTKAKLASFILMTKLIPVILFHKRLKKNSVSCTYKLSHGIIKCTDLHVCD